MSHDHHQPLIFQQRLIAIGIALASILIVILIGAAIGEWLTIAIAPVTRHPFSVGISEGGAATNGIAAVILDIQARFSSAMTTSLTLLKISNSELPSFLVLGFAYGIFHAAGPGHGKAMIAAYAFSREKAVGRTIAMASAAAALQALVAILLVTILSVLIRATAPTMRNATEMVEIASFLAIAIVGLHLVWNKATELAFYFRSPDAQHKAHQDHGHHDAQADRDAHGHHDHNGHSHAPISPQSAGLKGMISAIIAAGIRPCSGSILILVFALSQGLFVVGIMAALAIGIGTAITTSALAVFAILAKATATRYLRKHSETRALLLVRSLELLAAALAFSIGASLLIASLSGTVTNG